MVLSGDIMCNTVTDLGNAMIGNSYRIINIDKNLKIKKRLTELGFSKDCIVDTLNIGSFGSPLSFRVCGAVIALRKEDAQSIQVEEAKYHEK